MSPSAEVAGMLDQSRADRFVGTDRTGGAAWGHQDPDRARVRPRRTPRHSSANRNPSHLSATKQPLLAQARATGAIVRREAPVRHRSATAIFGGSSPARYGPKSLAWPLPAYVLVENVPGIARVPSFSTFRRFCRMLDCNRYQRITQVVDAKHYGVAPPRRRLVLLAAHDRIPSLPAPTRGSARQPFRTLRQSIARFPPIPAGGDVPEIPNHVAAAVSALNLERLRSTPHDGGDRRSWPARLRLPCHSGAYSGHTDVYGRMFWDRPAPALTGRCCSVSNGRYGHPEQDRAISLREAAAIQSFPDQYRFFGTKTDIAQQVGNAVPVRLAECLGRHILSLQREAYLKAA